MKKTKLLSLVLVFALAVSVITACGNTTIQPKNGSHSSATAEEAKQPSGQPGRQTVSFIVSGQPYEEDYCVFDSDILSIAYDDKVLHPERPDMDDKEIVKFESTDPLDLDIEIYASSFGNYASAAEKKFEEESRDDDTVSISSQSSDVDINGYKAKYFTVLDDESCCEYYYIEYTGTVSSDIKYVVIESEYNKSFELDWNPRIYSMARTIVFK